MQSQRLRVLLIAEAANPEWASVPLVGWSHARALAAVTDAHLVTHVRNQPALERAGMKSDSDFTAIDSDLVMRPLWRLGRWLRGDKGGGWTTSMALLALGYPYFEHLVWKHFEACLRAHEFDLVHRLTPLSPAVPSPIASRCARVGVPFVIGPLNGGTPWPPGFERERRAEREWLLHLRGAHRWLPGYRATRERASAIVVGSRAAWDEIAVRQRPKTVYVPENGIDPDRLPSPAERAATGPLRVAFIGRLVPYKGAHLLLDALEPLLRSGRATLDIIGDGPQRAALEQRAGEIGAPGSVRFLGWLEHRSALEQLARVHVLGFPSLREFGGGAVLEAMGVGTVPVVVNYGGPSELVTDGTGFRVPLEDRVALTAHFRKVLTSLSEDRRALFVMAEAARRRVQRLFTWKAKSEQMLEVYRFALGNSSRPDFSMPLS